MLNLNLNAVTGYISDVLHGREVCVGGRRAQWTKVENLKAGQKIAVVGENLESEVAFDEIVEINELGEERVFDIEVEGTRNFVANGILAHNTYLTDSNTATSSAFIENSNTAAGIVGLTMKLGSTTLDTTSHFVNFLDLNGNRIGSIRAANTTTVAYQTSGIADFGEYMKRDSSFSDPATLSPGTVTCFGSDGIKPCESGDTAKIVGVASDTTAFVGGDEKPENTIVGFLGQIKVKVATDSGTIAVGDPIGVGTGGRARKLAGRGYAVGMAIEPWTPGQDKVLVYVNPGYYEGARDQGLGTRKSIDELQAQIATLSSDLSNWSNLTNLDMATISGDLKVLGLTELANTNIGGSLQVGLLHFDDVNAEISSLTGMVTIDGELTAKKFNVSGDSAGKATILSGQTEIEITTSALNTNSLIFATPEDTPVPVSTTKTAANKFKIKLAAPLGANLKVSWWIVN